MIKNLRRLLHCRRATAAVEAAIFAPIFLLFTLGITDLGTRMFAFMQINAATQAGAIYVIGHLGAGSVCETLTPACLAGIKAAMNDAIGESSFCTGSVCTASMGLVLMVHQHALLLGRLIPIHRSCSMRSIRGHNR